MSNELYSKISQDYGYESSGEQVKFELKVKDGATSHTVTAHIAEGDSYTVPQMWTLLVSAFKAEFPALDLSVVHNDAVAKNTYVYCESLEFVSIEIFVNENNPRSLELPQILGFNNVMLEATGSVKIDAEALSTGIELPYMGSWKLRTELWTGQDDWYSQLADWEPAEAGSDTNTDITRNTLSNGPYFVQRGMKITVENVPWKFIQEYDDFLEFASRQGGIIDTDLSFDLFGDGTDEARLWTGNKPEVSVLWTAEQLMSYSFTLLPSSRLR